MGGRVGGNWTEAGGVCWLKRMVETQEVDV